MAAGFRTRRIKSETSIGDRLKRARTRQKVTVAEVEEQTKIRAKFILALESDSWEQIPSEVYGRGYLETYALFLKIPVAEIMSDYDKMRGMYARRCQQGVPEFAPKPSLKLSKFVITPRLLMVGALSIAILVGGVAAYNKIASFSSAPYLRVPMAEAKGVDGSPQIVINTNTVTVKGNTAVDAILHINGREVPVQSDGSFSADVPVQKGSNTIEIKALGRSGKESTQLLQVYVQ